MKINLMPFQIDARKNLRDALDDARDMYAKRHKPQIVSFTANTGAGKTIILISLVESIYRGDENYPAQRNAIFIWLSDSPELNEQSRQKFFDYADEIIRGKLITIDDETFDGATLADGKIYFLNTQKLSKTSNLTKHGDNRQYTIWETLQRTAAEKSDRLYLIIDEAHRGAQKKFNEQLTIMQKFIKGSPDDGLTPLPVTIGVSATIERFNDLVKNSGTAINYCAVPAEDVRQAGLLKDRILVVYPDADGKDMSLLSAATLNWLDKCDAWQRHKVKPIFIVQVQSGTGKNLSDTDLDECLKIISDTAGKKFQVGEIVHTFGEAQDLTLNGLKVVYREPSKISADEQIKIVLFKESLSTGWDCPRAETMMSFRRAVDATYIAQLIGRMIRTPLHRRIDDDETLNEVQLFLPQFDRETVKNILDKLQRSEFGAVTDFDSQSSDEKKYQTCTIRPKKFSQAESPRAEEILQVEPSHSEEISQIEPSRAEEISQAESPRAEEISQAESSRDENFSLTPLEIQRKFLARNREEIFNFINTLGLTTYRINKHKSINRLTALFKLARLLNQSGIYRDALNEIQSEFLERIRAYVDKLKSNGDYDAAVERVRQLKLNADVIDLTQNKTYGTMADLFSSVENDIDRQFEAAKKKFCDDTIANEYRKKYNNAADASIAKIEVILFTASGGCMDKVDKFAEKKYREFDDKYRREFAGKKFSFQNEYDQNSEAADEISRHNFQLPERITLTWEKSGVDYDNHLFVDENGTARIKLDGNWETGVLAEEQQRKDFVCWLRNFDRKPWALCLPYQDEHGEWRGFYPDMLIFRRAADNFIVDVLEPHDSTRRDNLGKARALANYAEENSIVGRIELIRQDKYFRRLDMKRDEIREKVLKATSNAELDDIFKDFGEVTD